MSKSVRGKEKNKNKKLKKKNGKKAHGEAKELRRERVDRSFNEAY